MIKLDKFNMKSPEELLKDRGLDKNGRVQKKLDREVIRESEKYTPKDTGELIDSVNATRIGSGKIEYDSPYAREVYYNKKNYNGAPMRGAYWFERMKTDNVNKLLRDVAKESGGEGER